MCSTRTWMLVAAAAAATGCSSSTSPNDGGTGGGGGGPIGSVKVSNIFFESGHNGTRNPAQDTVAVGQTVTWTWTGTGVSIDRPPASEAHSVRSQGSPSFTSSGIQSGNGATYTVTFTVPGTYDYDCAVHGNAMTGTIVVQSS